MRKSTIISSIRDLIWSSVRWENISKHIVFMEAITMLDQHIQWPILILPCRIEHANLAANRGGMVCATDAVANGKGVIKQ